MHYLLFYEAAEDYLAKRAQFRGEHLQKAWKASERGELVLAGALANPVDGAVLLFKGESADVAEKFARSDPYVTNGMVKRWYVREWKTVAGLEAAAPLRPDLVPSSEKERGKSLGPDFASNSAARKHVILRMWRGRSSKDKDERYVRHATETVFPKLGKIEGHRGSYLLRRGIDGDREFLVLTLWESMEAVRKFAGEQPDRAVVEPEARTILKDFDEFVTHFEIVQHIGEAQ